MLGVSRRKFLQGSAATLAVVSVGLSSFGSGKGGSSLLKKSEKKARVSSSGFKEDAMPDQVTALSGETVYFRNGSNCGMLQVHVNNGRIIRIRPAQLDPAQVAAASWSIKLSNGVTYSPPKMCPSPLELGSKARVYSPMRILYPMQRVDWNPGGPTGKGYAPQNRGVSEYVRITWDQANSLVASELTRLKTTYGPSSVYFMFPSHWSHGGYIHDDHYAGINRLLCLANGGYTSELPNPDSWEGWYWGNSMTMGFVGPAGSFSAGAIGNIGSDSWCDIIENSEMAIVWGVDTVSTNFMFSGPGAPSFIRWVKEAGVQLVFVQPEVGYTNGLFADKWISVNTGTDAALGLAIAYVWLQEGTYDTNFISTHTYGFDKWQARVMGTVDGVPKTPEWAEPITGVKAAMIRVLARQWASKKTALCNSWGSVGRTPFAHEAIRVWVLLQAMQGLGKPGRGIWDLGADGPSNPNAAGLPDTEGWGATNRLAKTPTTNSVVGMIWRTQFAEAVLNPPQQWYGLGWMPQAGGLVPPIVTATTTSTDWYAAHFNTKYTYPQKGESEIHAIYHEGTSQIANWGGTAKYIQAYQSSQIETIIMLDYWYGSEGLFADILLPACTEFERNDISGWLTSGQAGIDYSFYNQQCIPPLGESMGDLEIQWGLASQLGILSQYMETKTTDDDYIQAAWNLLPISKYMTYDQWKTQGYILFPNISSYTPTYPWVQWAEATNVTSTSTQIPASMVLGTPSNLIEFDSQRLESWFPNDTQRSPVPNYVQLADAADPNLAAKYPLTMESPHPKFRAHTQGGDVAWFSEVPTQKLLGPDGYYYERIWINPTDAQTRGISDGDLVTAYNDRATVIFAAYVSDRVTPGNVRANFDSRYDPLNPSDTMFIDRGGAVNLLSSDAPMSQNCYGLAPSGIRVEVALWQLTTASPSPTDQLQTDNWPTTTTEIS